MEQSMIIDSSQQPDTQCLTNDLTTPSRVQKRLFVPSGSSSKRSLFREEKEISSNVENVSDAESDLGPMSPLALTDHSSCDSSPGRQFISPLVTPEKSPAIPLSSWNRLTPTCMRKLLNEPTSPFSSLKRVTRSARFSPRQIFTRSPKSKLSEYSENCEEENRQTSSQLVDETIMPDKVVPETPGKESDFDDQQSYVEETPQKEEYSEYRLITPLGSMCKNIPIPRIHRRKSLGSLDFDECTSPEIKKCSLKRQSDDLLSFSNLKYQKTDELSSVPKARAALFQDNKSVNEKKNEFSLNPKLFYGSSDKSRKSTELIWKQPKPYIQKRRSLPSYSSSHRRATKKLKKGEINRGVSHGIKRPKAKRQSLPNIAKTEKQNNKCKSNESKENLNPQTEITKNLPSGPVMRPLIIQIEKLRPESVEQNKKFFKSKPEHNAVVNVNDKIKLNILRNETDIDRPSKKAKLDHDISFDAADLSVDEPSIEASLEQNKVANILKILEDDWADDDYDTMETAQTSSLKMNSLSPKKSNVMLKNLTMSPASELSSMTSVMNIDEDISGSTETVNKTSGIPPQKFYPLFSKGYSSENVNDDNNSKKRKRTTWQLSKKYGSTEDQYQIDAGQKLFGAIQCNECGIVYQVGDPDDENAHLNYHNSFKTLKFQGWKKERVIYRDSYTSSRIILVEPKDSNLYWKKVSEVLEIVDRDLGLSDMKLSFYRDKKVYMYVRDKTILGVLVAEYVKNAFKMIPELIELNCCTSETVPVKCGVNVVWTAMSHRRQGIATKLVDTMRANYYYGYIMSTEDIAFSTPTPSGKYFAEKYTKTRNFKVY